MKVSREMMNRKSIFPWQPGGVGSKSGWVPMSQTVPLEPDAPTLVSVELPAFVFVLVDELVELPSLVSSGTVVTGAVVPGGVVKPVAVSPPGLHASTPASAMRGVWCADLTKFHVSAGGRLSQAAAMRQRLPGSKKRLIEPDVLVAIGDQEAPAGREPEVRKHLRAHVL